MDVHAQNETVLRNHEDVRRYNLARQRLVQGATALHLDAAAGKGLILRRVDRWRNAVQLQHDRLIADDRRHIEDLYFYVSALDHLVDGAKLARDTYPCETRLAAAVASFEHQISDLATLRDVLEHWEKYDHRRGRLQATKLRPGQRKMPDQRLGQVENPMLLEHDAVISVYGMTLRVSQATPAALTLAEEVLTVVQAQPDW
jgi:hypothetical protein